jgi:hypothetical protein
MATFNLVRGGATLHAGRSNKAVPHVVERVIDFSKVTNTIADVFQALAVPAGTLVLKAGIEVLTAGTGTGTLALGDGVNTYSAASVVTSVGFLPASTGNVVLGTVDTLDLTVAVAAVNAKIRVWAVLTDLDGVNAS